MSRNWGWRTALLALCVVLSACGGDGDSPSVAAANMSAAAQPQGNENGNENKNDNDNGNENENDNGNDAARKNAAIRVAQYVNPLIGTDYATDQPADRLCTACFSGVYPVELPDEDRLGKGVLELDLGLAYTTRFVCKGVGLDSP